LAIKKQGMTDKNRARLRQFDDAANVEALLTLPYRVLREVERADMGRRRDALRVMAALAVELLIVAPVRVKNLTSLEIDRHIVRTRLGADATVHLVIPAHEVKNDQPCEMVLPPETVELLDLYLSTYRPRLSDVPSPWLFPNDEGGRRVISRFSTGIKEFLRDETGIEMNVHLFRHLAMKLHFAAHPEDLESGRRVLGHKDPATTLRFYTELKSPAAFERYDATIAGLRQAALARLGVSSPKFALCGT
jgi:integrase